MVYYYIIVTHTNMETAMAQCGEIMMIIAMVEMMMQAGTIILMVKMTIILILTMKDVMEKMVK